MSLFGLTGRVAVVTGATKGIGLGIVRQLAAQGARVVVCSRSQVACDQVADELNQQYGAGQAVAKGVRFDLNKLDEIDQFADAARQAWGRVDVLVCNAAMLPYIGRSADTPPEMFDQLLSRNIHHNFRLCQALRPDLAVTDGSIILIGSVAGHTATPMTFAYGVAKAGVAHMARSLADELAGERIRVNCVAPGLIRSASSTATLGEQGLDRAAAAIPLGRVGEPDDIAGAVVFLASRAGSYVTGTTIYVDGGRTFLSSGQANTLRDIPKKPDV